ncbi:MAG: RNA polymerase sigma-70 factor [Bacteroidota bacterium]
MIFKITNTDNKSDFRSPHGFELLYQQYAKKLFAICYSRIQHREESEEIVHDIFKSVWERKEEIFNEKGSIERYLIKAVKLKTIDFFRKQYRRATDETCEMEEFCGSEHCTENDFNLVELQSKVAELVDQLPCTCKSVYQLSRQQGLSNKEIASRLLISEKTVESHMTKALKHFRTHLAEYATALSFFISTIL